MWLIRAHRLLERGARATYVDQQGRLAPPAALALLGGGALARATAVCYHCDDSAAAGSRPRCFSTTASTSSTSTTSTTSSGWIEPWLDHARPIEEAGTLPASWYASEAVAAAERARVFGGSPSPWLLVGHEAQLPRTPGAFITGSTAQWRWVVARGEDGELRAFHNVCRHHAAPVASGSGVLRDGLFTCCYHGWQYALDGRLARAPRLKGIRGFKAADFGLRPVRLSTVGPLVFLQFGAAAGGGADGDNGSGGDGGGGGAEASLGAEAVGRMRELGALDGVAHVARRSYALACNWKVFADNFLDGGYHVPVAHAALAGQLDLRRYACELLGAAASVQTCAAAPQAGERVAADRPAAYFYLYPNAMLNRYGPWLDINVVTPLTPTTCRVDFDWFLETRALEGMLANGGGGGGAERDGRGAHSKEGQTTTATTTTRSDAKSSQLEFCHADAAKLEFVQTSLASSDLVQREDIALCEAVQVGLQEPAYASGGRYAPALEGPMFHFHKQVYEAVMRCTAATE